MFCPETCVMWQLLFLQVPTNGLAETFDLLDWGHLSLVSNIRECLLGLEGQARATKCHCSIVWLLLAFDSEKACYLMPNVLIPWMTIVKEKLRTLRAHSGGLGSGCQHESGDPFAAQCSALQVLGWQLPLRCKCSSQKNSLQLVFIIKYICKLLSSLCSWHSWKAQSGLSSRYCLIRSKFSQKVGHFSPLRLWLSLGTTIEFFWKSIFKGEK